MDWLQVFDEIYSAETGATPAQLACLQDRINAALSEDEITRIERSQRNPFPINHALHAKWQPFDPRRWTLPKHPLPPSLLQWLAYANGGSFRKGKREWGLFGSDDIRPMMLDYHVPEYMPLAVPIGLDGSGNFFMLDMRQAPVGGEYPIVAAAAGNLGWAKDECAFVAPDLAQAVCGTSAIEDLIWQLPLPDE